MCLPGFPFLLSGHCADVLFLDLPEGPPNLLRWVALCVQSYDVGALKREQHWDLLKCRLSIQDQRQSLPMAGAEWYEEARSCLKELLIHPNSVMEWPQRGFAPAREF